MGFIFQIIGIFLLGFFNAWLYVRKLRKRSVAWTAYLWIIANLGMWALGIVLYLDIIPGGKAWMWSDFLGMNVAGQAPFQGTDALAVILFLAYPCFYLMGTDGGRMLYGKKSYEGGLWWAVAPLKKPKVGQENQAASAGLIAPVPKPEEEKK